MGSFENCGCQCEPTFGAAECARAKRPRTDDGELTPPNGAMWRLRHETRAGVRIPTYRAVARPNEGFHMLPRLAIVAFLIGLPIVCATGQRPQPAGDLLAGDVSRLVLENVTVARSQYRGRDAVRVVVQRSAGGSPETMAVVPDVEFSDGVIEVEIAGVPAAGADTSARGFVGIAFRVDSSRTHYAAFYLRPTNGRARDQLRRNHSTQYIAHPEFPWNRLRQEQPGVYESYVDLEPGAWTPIRIEVHGGTAQLFVNRSAQPVLIVNDMKNPPALGRIALWIDAGTDAHFSRLRVTPATGRPER